MQQLLLLPELSINNVLAIVPKTVGIKQKKYTIVTIEIHKL